MLLTENTVVAERFKLSKMIGQGGMGSVWQATDLRLSTTCAVKFIEGEMANMAEGAFALPARGAGRGAASQPARRADLRSRCVAGASVHRDGAPRRRGSRQAHHEAGRSAPERRRECRHPAGLPRPFEGACRGRRAPRSQARQHLPRERRRPRDREDPRSSASRSPPPRPSTGRTRRPARCSERPIT